MSPQSVLAPGAALGARPAGDLMTHPFQHVATELARYALSMDLLADQVTNRPEPLSRREAMLLTLPVFHLQLALERLEDALYHAD